MSFDVTAQRKIAELESQVAELTACVKVQADNVSSLMAVVGKMQDGQDMLLSAIKALEGQAR